MKPACPSASACETSPAVGGRRLAGGYTCRPKVAAAMGACALALLALVFGLGALVGHGSGGGGDDKAVSIAPNAGVTETALRSGTRTVGGVMVYAGNPRGCSCSWMTRAGKAPSGAR
jgi:hypothetical protein